MTTGRRAAGHGTARRRLAGGLLAVGLGLVACGGDSGTAAPSPSSSAPTSSAPAGSAPTGSAPSSSTPTGSAPTGSAPAPGAVGTAAADGLALTLPAGWKSTALTPDAREQAVRAESDPRVQRFLQTRLEPLAAAGAVLYLYDLREVTRSRLTTVEVYRYPAGRTPQEVVDQVLLPRYTEAGLAPVTGETDLPAGRALTVSGTLTQAAAPVSTTAYVLPLGPTTVGVSATDVGSGSPELDAVVRSLRAG